MAGKADPGTEQSCLMPATCSGELLGDHRTEMETTSTVEAINRHGVDGASQKRRSRVFVSCTRRGINYSLFLLSSVSDSGDC